MLQKKRRRRTNVALRKSFKEGAERYLVDPEGKLARQAKGSWKKSEGAGTAVEIVRRLRDEWK